MKKFIIKLIISLFLATALTIRFYWPIYQNIKLNDSTSDISTEVKRLDLPMKEELREVLNMVFRLPFNRFQLCLENNNRVYLIHSDSKSSGFEFKTDDISQREDSKEAKVGAMTIGLYYQDGLEKDEIYREINQQRECLILDEKKLQHYASSTALYRYFITSKTDEYELKGLGKLLISRIVGNSYTDTSKSSLLIAPRWYLLLLTLFTITGIFYILFGFIWAGINKIRETLKRRKKK